MTSYSATSGNGLQLTPSERIELQRKRQLWKQEFESDHFSKEITLFIKNKGEKKSHPSLITCDFGKQDLATLIVEETQKFRGTVKRLKLSFLAFKEITININDLSDDIKSEVKSAFGKDYMDWGQTQIFIEALELGDRFF